MLGTRYGRVRSRAYCEGMIRRVRKYNCVIRGVEFKESSRERLPEKSQVCWTCRQTPEGAKKYDEGLLDLLAEDEKRGL